MTEAHGRRRPGRDRLQALLVGLAMVVALPCQSEPASSPAADLVVHNARIYTVDPARPWARAVAIKDGRILAVGEDEEVLRRGGKATRVVDMGGRTLLPAFFDAHVHPVFGGMSYSRCSLHTGESVEDYRRIITGCVAKTPGSSMIYGIGWRDGFFPPNGVPHKDVLDAISKERPLVFMSNGGHSLWLNSRALELAAITKDTPDPPNGQIDRDSVTGEPIGGLQEAAMDLMKPYIPAPSDEEERAAIAYTAKHFNSLGITGWHDAKVDVTPEGTSRVIDAYQAVRDRGELTAHVTLALAWDNERPIDQLASLLRASEHARTVGLRANTVKFYLDGVIPQHTAAMLEPYVDAGDDRGSMQIPPEVFRKAVRELDARGVQVHVHAIGDRAVRTALDAFTEARELNGRTDNRHLIAHLNLIDPEDQPRFGKLGVVANFQPLWANWEEYMQLTALHVGSRRMGYLYPVNSLVKTGATIAYGSDWPVASANPFEGIEVAQTRRAPGRREGKVLLAHEAVTLAQAIRFYTIDAAFVNHLESETGSIAPGKSADLIVLDRDVFSIPVNEISKTKVLLTLFEGREVFGSFAALQ